MAGGYYKPSSLAVGTTRGRSAKASPRTSDIDLPNAGARDARLPEPDRPLLEYDRARAQRQMRRPLFSRKVSR